MSAFVSDPNTLTKDKLKRELSRNNVELPSPDARKSVYVELYRQHVQNKNMRSEFSSDDDEGLGKSRKQKPGSPRKSLSKKSSKAGTMDVYSLTDDELIQQLKLYNIEYGPILSSTRRVYQKKLVRVLSGEDTVEASQTSSKADTLPVDDLGYSDEDEDEPEPEFEPEPIVRQTRTMQRKETEQYRVIPEPDPEPIRKRIIPDPKPVRNSTPQKASREDNQSTTYSRASRYTTESTSSYSASGSYTRPQPTKPSDLITQAKPTPEQSKKKGLSIWVQLLVVIIIAFIIFLVFQNMEPASQVPTRSIEQEV